MPWSLQSWSSWLEREECVPSRMPICELLDSRNLLVKAFFSLLGPGRFNMYTSNISLLEMRHTCQEDVNLMWAAHEHLGDFMMIYAYAWGMPLCLALEFRGVLFQNRWQMLLHHGILPIFHIWKIMQKINGFWIILAWNSELEHILRRGQSIDRNGHDNICIRKLVTKQILAFTPLNSSSNLLDCLHNCTACTMTVFMPIFEGKHFHCDLHDHGD